MASDVLPKELQDEIKKLLVNGYTKDEVFNIFYDKAAKYVKSERQLLMCISRLKREVINNRYKNFNKIKFQSIIFRLQ